VTSRAFIIPNPAKYSLRIVSEYAVARPDLRVAPADSSIKTRRLLINKALRESPCPKEAELASSPGLPESFGMARTKKTAPTEAVGCTIVAGQDGKMEILAYDLG
jgi:hypothetical protein